MKVMSGRYRFAAAVCGLFLSLGIFAQPLPVQQPTFAVNVTEGVVYGRALIAGGLTDLLLDLYEPVDANSPVNLSPAVVLIHGGAFIAGSRQGEMLPTFGAELAARGHVVVSIDYRLGLDGPLPSQRVENLLTDANLTEETEGSRLAIVAAVDDTWSAVDWLVANASSLNVDPARIGLLGTSAGAVTAQHLAYALNQFSIDGPDLAYVVSYAGNLLLFPEDNETRFDQLETGESPLLLIHGDEDGVIDVDASDQLFAQANQQCVPAQYLRIAGGGHAIGGLMPFTAELEPGLTIAIRTFDWMASALTGDVFACFQDGFEAAMSQQAGR